MIKTNLYTRITNGLETTSEESAPGPRLRRANYFYDGIAWLLMVLVCGAVLLTIKACLEAILPLVMHEMTEYVRLHRVLNAAAH